MTDLIRYDLLVQNALKSVVRRVLSDAARDGLPGEHHFYISFRTDHADVRISTRLKERYPDDMTIVLQHQFESLTVSETAFEVGLSFSGIPERLRIPFDALTGFFDPSVQFGLKFEVGSLEDEDEGEAQEGAANQSDQVPQLSTRKLELVDEAQDDNAKPRAEKPAPDDGGGQVVSLDAFRKKN